MTDPRRRRNPEAHYHVPRETVLLGFVLDLVLEDDQGETRLKIDEWDGWAMVTTAAGLDAAPGRARLYLLSEDGSIRDKAGSKRASETFERWHARGPQAVREYDTPEAIGYYQGRVVRIGYRSDKWHRAGDAVDYDHDMGEAPPRLYTDTEFIDDATAAIIVGGDMAVTEEGID